MLSVVFFGMGPIAAACFDAIRGAGHSVVGVLGYKIENSVDNDPLIATVMRDGLPLSLAPGRSKEAMAFVSDLCPDILVSMYYRYILPGGMLRLAPHGGINIHGSLLPKYQGRSPHVWAIINGETVTGVTVHYMVEEVDAGDIILQDEFPITIHDTGGTLIQQYQDRCPQLVVEALRRIDDGSVSRAPQSRAAATMYAKRTPDDGVIDWSCSSKKLYDWIRALTHPYPGAFTFLDGRRIFIWEAAQFKEANPTPTGRPGEILGELTALRRENCGVIVATSDGRLIVQRVQFEGETEVNARELLLDGTWKVRDVLG